MVPYARGNCFLVSDNGAKKLLKLCTDKNVLPDKAPIDVLGRFQISKIKVFGKSHYAVIVYPHIVEQHEYPIEADEGFCE
jgi:hypothetical protein